MEVVVGVLSLLTCWGDDVRERETSGFCVLAGGSCDWVTNALRSRAANHRMSAVDEVCGSGGLWCFLYVLAMRSLLWRSVKILFKNAFFIIGKAVFH